jgi:hypothetical protein
MEIPEETPQERPQQVPNDLAANVLVARFKNGRRVKMLQVCTRWPLPYHTMVQKTVLGFFDWSRRGHHSGLAGPAGSKHASKS